MGNGDDDSFRERESVFFCYLDDEKSGPCSPAEAQPSQSLKLTMHTELEFLL
jgi:hypothetical protein